MARAQNSRPPQSEFDKWHLEVSTDEITERETFKARLYTDAPPRGWFESEATCGYAGVFLQTSYLTGIDNEKDNPGTINHGLNKLLVVRMNLDGVVRPARSLPEKFNNAVTFQFMSPNALAKAGDVGVFAALADGLASAVGAPNPGTPAELFTAHSLKMEIPLGDGTNPILRIQPQDREFQKFAARCVKEFPDLLSVSDKNRSPIQPYLDSLKPRPDPTQFQKPSPEPRGPVYTTPVQPQPAPGMSNPMAKASADVSAGMAVLMIRSGIPGYPNPLMRAPINLMRDDLSTTLQKSGIRVPADAEPPEAFRRVCRANTADCDIRVLRASVAGAVATRPADSNGNAVLPPVQPGDYYILIYGYDASHRHVYWHEKITLKPGTNSFVAGPDNAGPVR